MKAIQFIKNWTLPISMISGVIGYFVYVNLPFIAPLRPVVNSFISILQPLLIFSMLFLTFCRISPKELRPCRWHLWHVMVQVGLFTLLSLLLILMPDFPFRVVVEGAMLCLICPTATAAAVVTGKLGGNAASLTTYTIIANISTALIAPVLLPMVHPNQGMTFLPAFAMIISKVFPLLICPLLAAWIVRYCLPSLHRRLIGLKNLAFYLWAVALAIAIAMTVKSIMHSTLPVSYEFAIAGVSLLCCALQFLIGKKIGIHYNESISAGQALGQKNTVFAIWMGYTFMTPITSIAGGFYSVWHNIYNSYQLYQKRKDEEMQNCSDVRESA